MKIRITAATALMAGAMAFIETPAQAQPAGAAPVTAPAMTQQQMIDAIVDGVAKKTAPATAEFSEGETLFGALELDYCETFTGGLSTGRLQAAAKTAAATTTTKTEIELGETLTRAAVIELKVKKDKLLTAARAVVTTGEMLATEKDAAKKKTLEEQLMSNKETLDSARAEHDTAEKAVRAAAFKNLETEAVILQGPGTDAAARAAVSSALAGARNDLMKLRAAWEQDGDFPRLNPLSPGGEVWTNRRSRAESHKELFERRKAIIECAERIYRAANGAIAPRPSTGALTARTTQNNLTAEQIKALYVDIAHQDIYDRAQATVLVGPTFVLKPDGGFDTGLETRVTLDNGAGSLGGFGRSFVDFAYISKTALDTTEGATLASNVTTALKDDDGLFRFTAGASTNLAGRFSLALTAGLNAIPGTDEGFLESLRERYTATILTRTFLSQGVYSRVSAGLAYDKSWRYFDARPAAPEGQTLPDLTKADQRESYGRAVVNVEVLLPPIPTIPFAASGALRLAIDTPINGNGPAEVRLSALAYLDFKDFFKALNPLYGR